MKISQNGIKFLKELEGSKKEMYLDSAGLLTIGVGHLLTKDELTSGKIYMFSGCVKYRDGLSDDQIKCRPMMRLRLFLNKGILAC